MCWMAAIIYIEIAIIINLLWHYHNISIILIWQCQTCTGFQGTSILPSNKQLIYKQAMKTIKRLSFQLIHLHKKTNNYDRGLISDMSEAVRIGTRPQFELNFDNRQHSVLSLHGVQSV